VSAARERVAVVACPSYERAEVAAAVRRAVELLGGMGGFVPAGARAFLKANLLRPASRESRVLTDGEVVRATAELVLEVGGTVSVGDSPALGSVGRNMRAGGITSALEGLECEAVEASGSSPAGSDLFPALELSDSITGADVLIDLPKLKTHVQMAITAAVKNMFGAVVGKRKPLWHLRCSTDRGSFARMLVECCRISAPALTVCDGVVAMQGQGPNSGDPYPLGVIIAATHPVAADLAFMRLIGLPPPESPVHVAARALGYGPASLAEVELLGDALDGLAVTDFRRADISFVMFPGLLGRALRRVLVSWPRVVGLSCVRCGQCAEVCAAGAITVPAGDGADTSAPPARPATIDYAKCIRCFCCHEVCPERAITLERPLLARIFGWGDRG